MSSHVRDEEKECFLPNTEDEAENKSLSEEGGDSGYTTTTTNSYNKNSTDSTENNSVDLTNPDDCDDDNSSSSDSVDVSSSFSRCKSVEVIPEKPRCLCAVNTTLSRSMNILNGGGSACKGLYLEETALGKSNSQSEKLLPQQTRRDSTNTCKRHEYRCWPLDLHPSTRMEAVGYHPEDDRKNSFIAVTLQHLNGQILPMPAIGSESENPYLAMQQQQQQQQQSRSYGVAYETSQSSDSVICRICHSSGDEKLIAPCKCAGSSRYVHEPCLVTWFKKSVKNECELCRSEVKIKKINHNIAKWRKPEDRPIPLIWFTVFFIGLFLNILSIHVNASEYCKSTACLIFYIVNGFGIILDSAFLYFWFLKCRHYCKKWFALNQDWFIDNLDSVNDVTQVQYVRNDSQCV